ncbi:right-handed parallel beta-helix repeat-containing protein [Stigmatella sp. ncwal1]|uniref:Right-handed parallel beta-helix repeat-containing protein n=1 Tax=Stigmatella ashevillensis TaxID=2995309 RepID=A0ABT5DEI4_9BACT|nr:right-handed parallel beta-helix repeat-containing protein [Stigmatella ashevillena]MDC0711523.1 right-handed parallel beta-helix repeat-containing protein [Stigmatella ashevillena]
MPHRLSKTHILIAALLLGVACSPSTAPEAPLGAARFVVATHQALTPEEVTRVEVTVQAEDVPPILLPLVKEGEVWVGLLSAVRAGAGRSFRAEAFDVTGLKRYEGQLSGVTIVEGETVQVSILAQEVQRPVPFENESPLIDSLVVSRPTVQPGGTVTVRAAAHDPNPGDTVTVAWTATGGSFGTPSALESTWTAPATQGSVTLTLTVTDARGAASTLSFTLQVEESTTVGEGSADVTVHFNTWPRVNALSAVPAQVRPNQPLTVTALAEDVDAAAGTLAYAWTASCAGTWSSSQSRVAQFTPTAQPAQTTCNNCQLTVTVSDGQGGATTGKLGICVGQPPVLQFLPYIESSSQSAATMGPGDLVTFRVKGADANQQSLSFAWTGPGVLSAPTTPEANTSEILWTAPSCLPAAPHGVTVTVTNTSGLSGVQRLPFQWTGPTCSQAPCAFSIAPAQKALLLSNHCLVDAPVFIPEGFRFEGTGHSLTAVDPPGGYFQGAVLRNRGSEAHVRSVTVKAQGLRDICYNGAQRLRGILFEDASGTITSTQVLNIRKAEGASGCQEGTGIEVLATGARTSRPFVDVTQNQVSGHQKTGIAATGPVDVIIAGNTVEGRGPQNQIVQQGIHLKLGAQGAVLYNQVNGHAYGGSDDIAPGILVTGGGYYGGPLCEGLNIEGNTLVGNDLGIYLSQLEANGNAPATPTRIRVAFNTLSHASVTNGYVYQAAIADSGTGNIITSNSISGAGYNPATVPGATFAVDVLATAASRLAFLTEPQSVPVGACSGSLTVQSQDAAGNLSVPAPATASLAASGAAASGVTFHTDATCTGAPVTALSLSNPHAEATFYFKGSQTGTVGVSVTLGALTATQYHGLFIP